MSRESYSVGYEQSAADFFSQRQASTHAVFLLPHLRQGMRLIDGGCGPGTITLGLAAYVAPGEVVGMDVELTQFELARRTTLDNVRFEVADLYHLPFPDESLAGSLKELVDARFKKFD